MTAIDDDDSWLEGKAREWPAPAGGYDNVDDVAEAKRLCNNMHGGINNSKKGREYAATLALDIRRVGISEALCVDLIMTVNEPALKRSVIEDIVANIYNVAGEAPGLRSVAAPRESEWKQDSAPVSVWPKPLPYDTSRGQHDANRAELFLSQRPGKIIVSDGVIYALDDETKLWTEVRRDEIGAEIRLTDPTLKLDTPNIRSMVEAIKLARFTKARPFEWIDKPANAPAPDDAILFGNGMLDFNTGKLLLLTGAFFATGVPSFDYDPDATCPLWLAKLKEWLDESYHPTLQEFMGYLLTPDTSIEKMLLMLGASRGGKGTILSVMQQLVGAAHHCARSLNDFGIEFGLEGTQDKRLITVPDAHSAKVNNRSLAVERLKAITGRDQLPVNRKNKTTVTALLPAKIVIVGNTPPKMLDDSTALAIRALVLKFERSFAGNEDHELRAKLAPELPGIANEAAQRELAESQSVTLRFARDCLIVTGDENDYVHLDTAFAAYTTWVGEESLSGYEIRNRNDFKDDLAGALLIRGVRHGRERWHDPNKPRWEKHGNGKVVRGFFGFKIKPTPVQ